MVATTNVSIVEDAWTLIATGAGEGFFTVFGDSEILFRQGTSLPPTTQNLGHRLEPKSDSVAFELVVGEMAYARATSPNATIVITLDG